MVLPWNCPRSVGTKVCQYWHSQVKAHQHLEAFCVVAEAQQCCPGNPGTPDHPLRQKVERNSCDARTAERGSKPGTSRGIFEVAHQRNGPRSYLVPYDKENMFTQK